MKIIAVGYIYQLANFVDLMSHGSKDIVKNAPCLMYSCTHQDVTDLLNHGTI